MLFTSLIANLLRPLRRRAAPLDGRSTPATAGPIATAKPSRTRRPILIKLMLTAWVAASLPLASVSSAWAAPAPRVQFKTSKGDFVVELDPAHAPKTVANFISYVQSGQYNGTIFHRVIPGFMIQGGGFDPKMNEKSTRPPIPLESNNGLRNLTGTIAMARTSNPDSATAQFFINTVDNANLDYPSFDGHGYAVFGHVVSGMDTVKKIEASRTGTQGRMSDVPVEPVVINSATLSR